MLYDLLFFICKFTDSRGLKARNPFHCILWYQWWLLSETKLFPYVLHWILHKSLLLRLIWLIRIDLIFHLKLLSQFSIFLFLKSLCEPRINFIYHLILSELGSIEIFRGFILDLRLILDLGLRSRLPHVRYVCLLNLRFAISTQNNLLISMIMLKL